MQRVGLPLAPRTRNTQHTHLDVNSTKSPPLQEIALPGLTALLNPEFPHISQHGPRVSIMMSPPSLSRGTHDVTEAGPPGHCLLLATRTALWMNTGPIRAREALGGTFTKNATWEGDSLPLSEARSSRTQRMSLGDTIGTPGSSHA